MATTGATIAGSITGIPEVSPEISIKVKQEIVRRRRVLIGWNHQNDNVIDLLHGKLWCWVTRHNHLMVFDAMFNRSLRPGEVRFCGVANFTMVRMFHPYWCSAGRVPRDMVSSDKERCRFLYAQRIRQFRIQYGQSVTPEPQAAPQATQPDGVEATNSSDEGNPQEETPRPGRGRGQGRRGARTTGRGRGRAPRRGARRRAAEPVTGREENVPGSIHNDPMEVLDECDDDDDNDSDNDNDMDMNSITDNEPEPEPELELELELDDLWPRVERHASRAIREDSTESAFGGSNSDVEEMPESKDMDGDDNSDLAHETYLESENNPYVIKTEEEHRNSGERNNPIIIADDGDDNDHDESINDDSSMFFPENSDLNLKPDPGPNTNRSLARDISHEVESMDNPIIPETMIIVKQDIKEERERKMIEVARTMEGPREFVVIEDD